MNLFGRLLSNAARFGSNRRLTHTRRQVVGEKMKLTLSIQGDTRTLVRGMLGGMKTSNIIHIHAQTTPKVCSCTYETNTILARAMLYNPNMYKEKI
jgi:hypothetical protein